MAYSKQKISDLEDETKKLFKNIPKPSDVNKDELALYQQKIKDIAVETACLVIEEEGQNSPLLDILNAKDDADSDKTFCKEKENYNAIPDRRSSLAQAIITAVKNVSKQNS